MDIQIVEKVVRVGVIVLSGRVDAFSVEQLDDQFDRLFEAQFSEFVVDLSDVTFLDSAGITRLVTLLKRSREVGGDVRLVWPKADAAQRILRLTKFDRVFTMLDADVKSVSLDVAWQTTHSRSE